MLFCKSLLNQENDRYPTILCIVQFHKNGGFPSTRGRFWLFWTWMFSEVKRCSEVSKPFSTTLRCLRPIRVFSIGINSSEKVFCFDLHNNVDIHP